MEAFDDDDDFGELYADVELPPLAPTTDLFIQQQQQQQQRQQPPDPNGNGDGGCVALSDSDDDDGLNIVLNDDEGVCNGLPPVARSDDVDDDCGGEGGGDGGGGERLEDRSEFLSKNGVRGGYGSLFFRRKYTRNQGLISLGIGSSLSKSWRNGDTCSQNLPSSSSHVTRICATPNPMGFQYGYGSVLPWYWSIFDVNIEMFPEKSWRVPGADITDYFNFGFNENTWKLYCASLEQLWQTTMGTGISGDESLKLTQEAMSQQIDEVVSGSALSPSSEFELPKGRAIQVEDNMIERKPSMDVKRPRNQDSDVIIQIKVHESSDDCSRSGNSTVMDASLEGEPALVDNKILTSSGELDVSEDQLEAVKKSVQERTGLIPEVDEHELQDEVDKHSNDAAQVPGGEMKSEQGIAIDTYSADPCWIESELSLGDQELSLTSYTDSDSEATENSVHVDNEKSHIPLRRQSVNSDISLKNSLPVHRKNSKGNSLDRRPPNVTYYSRNKRPFQKECRRQNGRHWRGSSLNYPIEYDNDSSSIPSYSARDLSLFGNQFIDYDICKERAPGFASRKRRYDRETKQSFYYGREKVNNNLFQTLHTKYSYRDDREIFREKTNQYDRKYENERDYFFESRSPMADDEGRERKWHDADLEYYADDLSPHSCWELRQFPRKHSSFPDEERGAHRRRMNDRFGDRYYSDDLDEYELEFLNTSYRISPYSERNMESLNNRHEESFSDIDIDPRRSARRDRHCDRLLDLDNLWPGKRDSQKYKHHQISKKRREYRQSYATSMRNYAYGTRVTEKLEVSRRYEHARNNRGSYGYTDAVEDEDFMIDPAEEYQCYRSPSEVLNWIEDENTFQHHEIHATSLHAKVQLGGIEFQQHQLNMPRSSENCLNGRSKIMDRGKCWQAVPRYRKSVHLVSEEGKSLSSSRVLHKDMLESVNQGMAKKRRALVGSEEFRHRTIKLSTSKCESNHRNKKSLQNIPDKGHKDCSDIEEGQIVMEEPCLEASTSRRDVSEVATLTETERKGRSKNENNAVHLIGGYDSQRILDTLAKMEKRRERFKQPISTKAEESSVINNDSAIDTGEMKQHRPARKRSWVGS